MLFGVAGHPRLFRNMSCLAHAGVHVSAYLRTYEIHALKEAGGDLLRGLQLTVACTKASVVACLKAS
jgi:hypothetical protein